MTLLMTSRLNHVKDECHRMKEENEMPMTADWFQNNADQDTNTILSFKTHPLLWCPVFKAASQAFRKIFFDMDPTVTDTGRLYSVLIT